MLNTFDDTSLCKVRFFIVSSDLCSLVSSFVQVNSVIFFGCLGWWADIEGVSEQKDSLLCFLSNNANTHTENLRSNASLTMGNNPSMMIHKISEIGLLLNRFDDVYVHSLVHPDVFAFFSDLSKIFSFCAQLNLLNSTRLFFIFYTFHETRRYPTEFSVIIITIIIFTLNLKCVFRKKIQNFVEFLERKENSIKSNNNTEIRS